MSRSPAPNQGNACLPADRQRSIKKSFSLSGTSLHSGTTVKLIFSPAPANSGIYFIKDNLKIPATVSQVVDTGRGTSLSGVAVVEHLLSAVSGLGLDNLEIEIFGSELPALDGCSLTYVEALEKAGIKEQAAPKKYLVIAKPIEISDGEASLAACPYRGFKIDFMVDFLGAGKQQFSFDPAKNTYKKEIAPARTFGYLEEYEALKKRGLGLGASLDNALVLDKKGYVNQSRFPDEVVRHKVLDLVGDLALLGQPLKAEITAVKSGHKMNVELARRILESCQN